MFKAKKGGVYFTWIALPKIHKGLVIDTPHAAYVAVNDRGSIAMAMYLKMVAAEDVSAHGLYLEVTMLIEVFGSVIHIKINANFFWS